MKKLFTTLLALIMVLGLTVPAFAANGTYTISMVGSENTPITGHTYKVYQIFTGDLSDDGKLSNIKYGANYVPTGKNVGDAVSETEIEDITDAEDFAKSVQLVGEPVQTLSSANNFSAAVAAGYYLIVDDTSATIPAGDSYSKYMVKVVEDVTMFPKSTTEQIHKNLSDDHHGLICESTEAGHVHGKDCYNWSKSNEVAIGETVHFQLDSAIPAAVADYTNYYFVMGDTASKGLSVDLNSIKVYAGDTLLTKGTNYTVSGLTSVTTGAYAGGTTFEVALVNAKAYAGQTIYVYYDAVLNADAVIGASGNPNEAVLKYSRNPYDAHEDKNNDGWPDDGKQYVDGTTPGETTITFATGIQFKKVDEEGKALQGAEFTVTGTAYNTTLDYVETFVEDANGAYYKLTSGKYTVVAPTFAKMVAKTDRDGGYVVAATNDPVAESDKTVDGTRYRLATKEEMAGTVALFKFVEGTAAQYASTTQKYSLVGKWVATTHPTQVNVVLTTDANGIATLKGLGDGTYHVTESVVPAGYNKIDDFDITITWGAPTDDPITPASTCTWTAKAFFTEDGTALQMNNEGVFALEVVNKAGTELPETGGIGTTLFYVFGGILVAAAAVVFVTKKRMGTEG